MRVVTHDLLSHECVPRLPHPWGAPLLANDLRRLPMTLLLVPEPWNLPSFFTLLLLLLLLLPLPPIISSFLFINLLQLNMSASSKDEGAGVAPQNKGSWATFLKVRQASLVSN